MRLPTLRPWVACKYLQILHINSRTMPWSGRVAEFYAERATHLNLSAAIKYNLKHKTQVHLQHAAVNGVSQPSIDDSIRQAHFIACNMFNAFTSAAIADVYFHWHLYICVCVCGVKCSTWVSEGGSSRQRFDIMGVMFSYALMRLHTAKVLFALCTQIMQNVSGVLIDCRDRIASK